MVSFLCILVFSDQNMFLTNKIYFTKNPKMYVYICIFYYYFWIYFFSLYFWIHIYVYTTNYYVVHWSLTSAHGWWLYQQSSNGPGGSMKPQDDAASRRIGQSVLRKCFGKPYVSYWLCLGTSFGNRLVPFKTECLGKMCWRFPWHCAGTKGGD